MADVDTCVLDEDDDATVGLSIWDGAMYTPNDQPEDEEDE